MTTMPTSPHGTSTFARPLPFWARDRDGILLSDVPKRERGHRPSFMIIGAAKCGTTSLHHYLTQHPALWMCPYKEPHFFSSDPIYARGLEWYEGLFADASPGQQCGEASTSYTRHPQTHDTPRRIYEYAPEVKLIYLVREPVARTESDCIQALKYERYVLEERELPRSLDVFLDEHPMLVRASEYIEQIDAYLRWFDRRQLLVIFQDDLAQDPRPTLRRIFEFLEVDPTVHIDSSQRHNSTQDFLGGLKQERAGELARRVPAFGLFKRVLPDALKHRLKAMAVDRIDGSSIIEPLSASRHRQLREHFRPFNRRLAEFLGRDLSHWD